MQQPYTKRKKNSAPKDRVKLGLVISFIVVGTITAILAFIFVKNLVTSWSISEMPGAPSLSDNTLPTPKPGALAQGGDLLQSGAGPTPQIWDGSSRVTVLLMGLDYDDTEARKVPRTDSMILFSMDPATKTAGILSIPRDLWVNIPDHDYGKINTAYFLGEAEKLPGGGAGLAIKTVEQFIGVPINYYAQIDFDAFTQFIDELGGIDINVPEKITVYVAGKLDKKGNVHEEKVLRPGVQTLDGATALAYARDRHTAGGDFDRAARQQQVIDAIRSQVLNFDMMPTLIAKAPSLYSELSSGIHTNLSLDQVVQLALYAAQVPDASIKHGIIGLDAATDDWSPDGTQAILKPITEKVRDVRDSVFSTTGPITPTVVPESASDPTALYKAENARVSIRNGSSTPGLAETSAIWFQQQGFNVVEQGNDTQTSSSYIIDVTGKPYTLQYLATLLNLQSGQIRSSNYDPNSNVDVIVVLGNDWAQSNPMSAAN
jgi:LCP family protein required for cell wall assembly